MSAGRSRPGTTSRRLPLAGLLVLGSAITKAARLFLRCYATLRSFIKLLMTTLFTPIQLGDLRLPNRIFMAPLTRSRGTEDHLPQADLMAKYYRQRATAGLILSEALPVAPMAVGYARVPGIWSPAQVEA